MSEAVLTDGQFSVVARRRRRRPGIIAGCGLIVGGIVVMALFGGWMAPQDPNLQHLSIVLARPTGAHWLGTDDLGRDIFSRIIVGSRAAFIGPAVIAVCSTVFGNALGLAAGYFGGRTDSLIMRWVDLMWAMPSLLLILVIAGVFGSSYWLAVGLLGVLTVPGDTRVIRGATLAQAQRPYVEAAKTLGVSNSRVMAFEIWPNIMPVAIAQAFLIFAGSLLGLAGLSFLGVGVRAGTPDWGLMLSESRDLIFINPWASLVPAAMIVVLATAMNLLGDWAFDWLSSRGATR